MANLVFSSDIRLSLSPMALFERFGAGDDSLGWLFGAHIGRLERGALVRLAVPLGGLEPVDGVARILDVVPYRRIELVHEAPWSGRVICRLRPSAEGTDLRLVVEVDGSTVAWMLEHLGLEVCETRRDHEVRIGLLVSLSGSAGIFGRGAVNCAELAADEVNADGGIQSRPLRIVVADDSTDTATGIVSMRRLLDVARVRAVVGMHSSATFAAVHRMCVRAGVPFLYAPTSEPMASHPLLLQLGETPVDQLYRALPRLAAQTGGSRWYLGGNDYSWPRAIGRMSRAIIENMGGVVVGESYLPLGSRTFAPVVDAIGSAGVEHVVSSFVGQDQVRFEREFARSGFRSSIRTFAPLLDDASCEHLGEVARGMWNVLGYFSNLQTTQNRRFLSRYRARFGDCAPPVSGVAEGVYDALHLWSRAAREAGTTEGLAVMRRLRGSRFCSPRGYLEVDADGHVLQDLYLGEGTRTGMVVIEELGTVRRASA